MQPAPFAQEIRKTGFVLENNVAQALRSEAWTVISNKYYVDDSEETVREIDLVAYRVSKVQHFDVYTVLVVSCKKSEQNAWALLARDINVKDPNSDWWPLHAWSNDKAIQYQLSQPAQAKRYHEAAQTNGVVEALSLPSVEVFAFQEMDKVSGRPQNDKPIFSAVTSLMKAQAYELSALPARKKTASVYQFNLLSVVDTDLVRLMFKGPDITDVSIDSEHYLARYIIRKRETFSRVRFIKASAFSTVLADYERLHQANCTWFATECDAFYDGLVSDWKRRAVLMDDFKKRISRLLIGFWLEHQFHRTIDVGEPDLYWSGTDNILQVGFSLPEDVLDFMNGDDEIKAHVGNALKTIYRYDGPFTFAPDVPF